MDFLEGFLYFRKLCGGLSSPLRFARDRASPILYRVVRYRLRYGDTLCSFNLSLMLKLDNTTLTARIAKGIMKDYWKSSVDRSYTGGRCCGS